MFCCGGRRVLEEYFHEAVSHLLTESVAGDLVLDVYSLEHVAFKVMDSFDQRSVGGDGEGTPPLAVVSIDVVVAERHGDRDAVQCHVGRGIQNPYKATVVDYGIADRVCDEHVTAVVFVHVDREEH